MAASPIPPAAVGGWGSLPTKGQAGLDTSD
jgi:hypothetical protein